MDLVAVILTPFSHISQVLGDGELPFPLTIKAQTFSKSAREKIEAGGDAKCYALVWLIPMALPPDCSLIYMMLECC